MKQTRSARAVCHIHFCTVAPTPKDDVAFRETDHVQNFCLAFCHQPTNLFPCKSPDGKLNPMPLPTPYSRVVSISFFLSPSPSSSSLHEWCLLFVNTRTRTTNREEGAEGGEKKIQYFCNAIKSSIWKGIDCSSHRFRRHHHQQQQPAIEVAWWREKTPDRRKPLVQ